ncbi:hypothetical protein Mapa_011250 [Marchantia paleacea]|nr:hypothetical protein Mapa_011250 [Marchantia paleacea]
MLETETMLLTRAVEEKSCDEPPPTQLGRQDRNVEIAILTKRIRQLGGARIKCKQDLEMGGLKMGPKWVQLRPYRHLPPL